MKTDEELRGHSTAFKSGELVYKDTGLTVDLADPRPCAKCGRRFGFKKPDACLSKLSGVKNACCGHGDKEKSYIEFDNGVVVRGFEVQIYKWRSKTTKEGVIWKCIDWFPYPERLKEEK